jgi:uncharacterized protein YqjF (DUF2071 family)
MEWHDLLFLHWPVRASVLRPLIPPLLELDTFDGSAWIGIVPFRMAGVHPHYIPALPRVSAFTELNVRTYVTAEEKPGVWFFSLDAASATAVRAARLTFGLPYYDALMSCTRAEETVDYVSTRVHRRSPRAGFVARYRPVGPVTHAPSGTVDRWLTERYCLYVWRGSTLWRGDIHHIPWPLQPAEAEIIQNSMLEPLRLTLPDVAPLLHFAPRLEVVAWMPTWVDANL